MLRFAMRSWRLPSTRLPYRLRIPVGVTLAVCLSATLITLVTARLAADDARRETIASIERAMTLIAAQARPMLQADDPWHTYTLLRDTVALLTGGKLARAAVLDTAGRVFASSDPRVFPVGVQLLGSELHGQPLWDAHAIDTPTQLNLPDGGMIGIAPIRSTDDQTLGFVMVDFDARALAPNWADLMRPVVWGAALALVLMVPVGWWLGRRMAEPVRALASRIHDLRQSDSAPSTPLPGSEDPELSRIARALEALQTAWRERRQAEQRALSSERLAAVGRIAGAVAHEINNPLAGLFTAVQTLRLHGGDARAREHALDIVEHGLQQIRTTVAALLPQARVEERALRSGDFDEVLTLANAVYTRGSVQMTVHRDCEVALHAPAAPVRQAMLNMLLNAMKAAGPGGIVEVAIRADAQRIWICVSNTGSPLDHAVFLATTRQQDLRGDPRGFGLWVCAQIANRYEGGFELDPDAVPRTRLTFWIPNHPAPETAGIS